MRLDRRNLVRTGAGLLGLGGAVALLLAAVAARPAAPTPAARVAPGTVAAPAPAAVVGGRLLRVPDGATDGALTVAIPAGLGAEMDAGTATILMPPVIRLRVGDQLVLRNEDDRPHILFDAVVDPGQTVTRTLTKPGIEVYTAGCTAVPTAGISLTSLIVSG